MTAIIINNHFFSRKQNKPALRRERNAQLSCAALLGWRGCRRSRKDWRIQLQTHNIDSETTRKPGVL